MSLITTPTTRILNALTFTREPIKIVKPDWNNNNYQIIYKRMTDDTLKSYWEDHSVDLNE